MVWSCKWARLISDLEVEKGGILGWLGYLKPLHNLGFEFLLVFFLRINFAMVNTLQGINISHLGKRKIIFKMPFLGDMLVSWRVSPWNSPPLKVEYFWVTFFQNAPKSRKSKESKRRKNTVFKILKNGYKLQLQNIRSGNGTITRVGWFSVGFAVKIPWDFRSTSWSSTGQQLSLIVDLYSGWWFQICPFWLIFFRWVETTN